MDNGDRSGPRVQRSTNSTGKGSFAYTRSGRHRCARFRTLVVLGTVVALLGAWVSFPFSNVTTAQACARLAGPAPCGGAQSWPTTSPLCNDNATVNAVTVQWARVDNLVENICVRTKGYLPDNCINNPNTPCMSIGDPSRPSRFRPEATAQAQIIRYLATMKNDVGTFNRLQWEVAPKPDSQYAPDVSNPNEPAEPANPATNWRIDIMTDQIGIIEVHRWSNAGPSGVTNDVNVQRVTAQRVAGYVTSAHSIGIYNANADAALSYAPWGQTYNDDKGISWCVWGDPDAGKFGGNAYFAQSSALPTQQVVQACGGTGAPPPTTVTATSPYPQNQHICFPCAEVLDAVGHALAHYLVRYTNFQGTTQVLAQDVQADANGNITLSLTTPSWTQHDELGMVIFDETSPAQVTDAMDAYVTSDC